VRRAVGGRRANQSLTGIKKKEVKRDELKRIEHFSKSRGYVGVWKMMSYNC